MSVGAFKRRSSWPSSFLTGLIGWNGFMVIAGLVVQLVVGDAPPAGLLFLTGVVAAVAQVLVLRLGFFHFGLDRGLMRGLVWGGLTGGALGALAAYLAPPLRERPVVWALDGVYIGVAVGLFLSYFYRDDRRIEAEAAAAGRPVDYGRDAHWLEPFFFGAAAYLLAFVPRSLDLAATALVVGAMSGVFAAGVSHFFLNRAPGSALLPVALGALAGVVQGAASGLLFRGFAEELPFSTLLHGAAAGVLTYLVTCARGLALARREGKQLPAG
ncbi:MAG TPA: hypothetical protein VD968_14825 [Pyrinomonadaceae bacterium]|nr:hypothetical protein [Pyrinomonadaceae bacterium]